MKIIFMAPYKNWFTGLGLHHALVALILFGLGSILEMHDYERAGAFVAAGGLWWYASREWGLQLGPPKKFEIMDFVSPAIVALTYLVIYA